MRTESGPQLSGAPDGPDLDLPPLEEWRATKDTLHLWAQILGKTKLALMPMRNHWWAVTLLPTARGLSTGRMPGAVGNLEIELNVFDALLHARSTSGEASFALTDGLSVASFYVRFLETLRGFGVEFQMKAKPYGVPMETPFADDHEHASFDHDMARRFTKVIQWSADVLDEFGGWYTGKTSPVHVFWHSFDLAMARYSGRRARAPEDADPVTAEAYSHEVIAFGFWPGDDATPDPSYYSYTAPEPSGLRDEPLRPDGAEWVAQGAGSLAHLALSAVRETHDPKAAVTSFFQSAFEAGASLQGWDLYDTVTDWCPVPRERLRHLTARRRAGP
jgi:hypothetical protein